MSSRGYPVLALCCAISLGLGLGMLPATGSPALAQDLGQSDIRPVQAQAVPPPTLSGDATNSPRLTFYFTPYLWISGTRGRLETPNGREFPPGGISSDFKDVVPKLNGIPFIGAGELRYDRWGAFADLITIGVRTDLKPRAGDLFSGGSADLRTTLATVAGFYRVIESGPHTLDLGAGLRISAIDSTVTLNPGRLRGASGGFTLSTVDGIGAIRYRARLVPGWSLLVYGDAGGGGSRVTWQALGGITWQARDWLGVTLGYRHLQFNDTTRRDGGIELGLTGPFLATTLRF